MSKIIAKAPGTCGEYLQGIYGGVPAIVSSPIDLYSTTIIEPGTGKNNLKPKQKKALKALTERYGEKLNTSLDIRTYSEIPVGKGMASSTADILSVIYAYSRYHEFPLTEEETIKIVVGIEPSDSTMKRNLCLFNHYTGEILEDFGKPLTAGIYIIDFNTRIDTEAFGYEREFKKDIKTSERALEIFREGLEGNIKKIGEATTLSALNNQTALYNPHLEKVIRLGEQSGGNGVMIGHSGSVIGILKSGDFDEAYLEDHLREDFGEEIVYTFNKKLIPGGVVVAEL